MARRSVMSPYLEWASLAVALLAGACTGHGPTMVGRATVEHRADAPEPTAAPAEDPPPGDLDATTGDVAADASACIGDPFAHAVGVIVDDWSAEITSRTGVRVTRSDYPEPGAGCTAVTELPDVDGDGVAEIEVSEGCSWGTYGALHLLYLSHHGCRTFAGALVAGELNPLPTVHDGVRDLEATWSNGCAGADFVWTRYAWAGREYREADNATCEFCPEHPPSPGANAHPHCRDWGKDMSKDWASRP